MALPQDIEVKGVTTFTSSPTTSHRYVIQLKDGKMSIWMEDRESKKQWYIGAMTKEDYVTSFNTITDASTRDYLKCFQDALDCPLEGSDDVQRELEIVKGGDIQLTLVITFRVLSSSRVAKFAFDLDTISVERIDVLESKLRDQQEELQRLREEFEAGQVLRFTASTKDATNLNLIWKTVDTASGSVVESQEVDVPTLVCTTSEYWSFATLPAKVAIR